ncbi:DUF6150 family protein [Undibacterium crateris]|uniref:DUF6150 family protein n=1 Tax=Undibacterium crateris TaxID=2528175 RepID=UPI0013899366|nr:DUF6150 family protein [Undibacterium crateris]NDI84145.1 hypothetical protein [Undibacterium crateris]
MARIYQTPTMGDAKIRVAIVTSQGEADLLVYRVSSWGLASGDALWFITRDKQDASSWVYFTSIGMAQVKVCFVDSMGCAGWQDRGQPALKFRGRFS